MKWKTCLEKYNMARLRLACYTFLDKSFISYMDHLASHYLLHSGWEVWSKRSSISRQPHISLGDILEILVKRVLFDNKRFIVDYGRRGLPEHFSAGWQNITLGQNFLWAKFKMAATDVRKIFEMCLFCLSTNVLLLIKVEGVFLNVFQPGALLAPLGKIYYGQNSKRSPPILGKSLNCVCFACWQIFYGWSW